MTPSDLYKLPDQDKRAVSFAVSVCICPASVQRVSSERLDWSQSVSGRRHRSLNAACWPHCLNLSKEIKFLAFARLQRCIIFQSLPSTIAFKENHLRARQIHENESYSPLRSRYSYNGFQSLTDVDFPPRSLTYNKWQIYYLLYIVRILPLNQLVKTKYYNLLILSQSFR